VTHSSPTRRTASNWRSWPGPRASETQSGYLGFQKPGLALAGYTAQIQRRTEFRSSALRSWSTWGRCLQTNASPRSGGLRSRVACFVATKGWTSLPSFSESAEATRTPLLRTPLTSSIFIERVSRFLRRPSGPTARIHGVLVDVMEVGILLVGPSGIGRASAPMDLVFAPPPCGRRCRGRSPHAAVRLLGRGEDLIATTMEIRASDSQHPRPFRYHGHQGREGDRAGDRARPVDPRGELRAARVRRSHPVPSRE